MSEEELLNGHNHSFKNRQEIEQSTKCGCFNCQRIYCPTEVEDYVDEGKTALCPYCGIDSVIGDASDIQISKEMLHDMFVRWME